MLEGRKSDGMNEEAIKKMCANHKNLFVLWGIAFSLARTVDPDDDDIDLYKRYVFAAVQCHVRIGCNVTHKVHLMWRHVAEQMKNVLGGLGEKMEDWVERQHQDGKRSRDAYRRVANVQARADARAHKGHRRCRADIRAQVELVKSDASRNLKRVKDESAEMKRRKERPWNSSSVQ